MDKKYANSFANVFMANLEDEVLCKAKCKPLVMFRFIATYFSSGPIERCPDIIHHLSNSHDESINNKIVILMKHQ